MPDPDNIPRQKSPLPVMGVRLLLCLLIYWLDIAMFIISIMAYKGAQSDDSRAVLKTTFTTFPAAGHHIQRTEIALVSFFMGSITNHWGNRRWTNSTRRRSGWLSMGFFYLDTGASSLS